MKQETKPKFKVGDKVIYLDDGINEYNVEAEVTKYRGVIGFEHCYTIKYGVITQSPHNIYEKVVRWYHKPVDERNIIPIKGK